MIGTKAFLRLRMSAHEAHYAGELVDGARMLGLFGDLATELLVRIDGDEGLFRAYESIEFLAPVFAGDFIEASAEIVAMGGTSRKMVFEARKVIANTRKAGFAASAGDVLEKPVVVCRAVGTCVTPRELQRRPRALYMPALPPGPAPETGAVVTPVASEIPEDVILTAAIVGAELTREQTPWLPITPQQIADEAARCREAGAAVIHLHVRNEDGSNTQSADRFAAAIEAIRAKTDCIVQITTGGEVGMSMEVRAEPLGTRPEMATLNCGSLNFGEDVFVNKRPEIRDLARRLRAAGAMPELECYEVGHLEEALLLYKEGLLAAPLHFQFVMGVPGGIGATEANLLHLRSLLPTPESAGGTHIATWAVAAVGRFQKPMTELAIRLGGHARLGLEDNIYISKGVLSEGSAPLVAQGAQYARSIGRRPVDPSRARVLLGLLSLIEHTFVADALTPVAAYAALRRDAPDRPSFLLESVVGGERWGRYSILGYRPDHELRLGAEGWERVRADGSRSKLEVPEEAPTDPLAVLSHALGFGKSTSSIRRAADAVAAAQEQTSFDPADRRDGHPGLKLASSYVGVFAWDLVHAIDRVRDFAAPRVLPMARLVTGGPVVVFDSLAQTVTVAAKTDEEVQRALAALSHPPPLPKLAVPERGRFPRQIEVDVDDATFRARVAAAQEHIRAGDAFQIVLARSFSVARDGRDPFDVYRAMRLINPSPYMYFFDFPAEGGEAPLQIAGASPETLARKEGTTVTIRPLAGTRPRGSTEEEDLALEKELLADPKERAEHVMLIDLGRNDVGRVAEVGTVKLRRKMEIERYSHVMHIVSEVEGQVPPTTSPLEVLRAAFPAGTLSGAPKLRAMQIIRELEGRPRGVYGGAVGYVAENGDLDLAIAIRTAVFRDDRIEVSAGAGVVDASDPASEADETRNKARAVLCAIEAAPSDRSEKG